MLSVKKKLILVLTALFLICSAIFCLATNYTASASNENDYFIMTEGASVRFADNLGKSGIRFTAEIGSEYFDGRVTINEDSFSYKVEGARFGIIIVPEQYLYHERYGFVNQIIVSDMYTYFSDTLGHIIDLRFDANNIKSENDKYFLVGSIAPLYLENYNIRFCGIGYYFNGVNFEYATPEVGETYYSNSAVRLASLALNDVRNSPNVEYCYETTDGNGDTVYSPYSEDKIADLEGMIRNGVLAQQGVVTYDTRIGLNGNLYDTVEELVEGENISTSPDFKMPSKQVIYLGTPAKLIYENFMNIEYQFTSSNTSILEISHDGLMTPKTVGEVTITASALNNKFKQTTTVTIIERDANRFALTTYNTDFIQPENIGLSGLNATASLLDETSMYSVTGDKVLKTAGVSCSINLNNHIRFANDFYNNETLSFYVYALEDTGIVFNGGILANVSAKTWTKVDLSMMLIHIVSNCTSDGFGNLLTNDIVLGWGPNSSGLNEVYFTDFTLNNNLKNISFDFAINDLTPHYEDNNNVYTIPYIQKGVSVDVYDVTASEDVVVTNNAFNPTKQHTYTLTYTLTDYNRNSQKVFTLEFDKNREARFTSVPSNVILPVDTTAGSLTTYLNAHKPTLSDPNNTLTCTTTMWYHINPELYANEWAGEYSAINGLTDSRNIQNDWIHRVIWTTSNEFGSETYTQYIGARTWAGEFVEMTAGNTTIYSGAVLDSNYKFGDSASLNITGDYVHCVISEAVTDTSSMAFAVFVANNGASDVTVYYIAKNNDMYSLTLKPGQATIFDSAKAISSHLDENNYIHPQFTIVGSNINVDAGFFVGEGLFN